jgi:hypothetical protein
MGAKIKIKAGEVEMLAELNDSTTAQKIYQALPIEARVNTWGDEIYFSIPVRAEAENPQPVVEVGDLGYWMPGNAFCIFFGPTPNSTGDEIRPASPVNIVGKVLGEAKEFRKVSPGTDIRLEKA